MALKQRVEKMNLLEQKRAELKKIFDEARTSDPQVMDFEKVKMLTSATICSLMILFFV